MSRGKLDSIRVQLWAVVPLMFVLLSGCTNQVSLNNLLEYDGIPRTDRPVVWIGGKLSDEYVVQDQDVLYLSSKEKLVISRGPLSGPNLSENRKSAALPVWVGKEQQVLDIEVGGGEAVPVCFKPSDRCKNDKSVDLAGSSRAVDWLTAFRTITALQVEIVPNDPGLVVPGDDVQIGLSFLFDLEHTVLTMTGQFPESIHSHAVIKSNGALALPRISAVNPMLDQLQTDLDMDATSALYRVMAGAMETGESEVYVWSPQNAYPQIPLWRIARCLNGLNRVSGKSPAVEDPACETARIDERFNPRQALYLGQRYDLAPGPRTWTLVDLNGRRHSVPYQYGISVTEAVETNYAVLTGRDLETDAQWGRPFLVVLPSPLTRDKPFYGQLAPKEAGAAKPLIADLGGIGIKPGDTVIVTEWRPITVE